MRKIWVLGKHPVFPENKNARFHFRRNFSLSFCQYFSPKRQEDPEIWRVRRRNNLFWVDFSTVDESFGEIIFSLVDTLSRNSRGGWAGGGSKARPGIEPPLMLFLDREDLFTLGLSSYRKFLEFFRRSSRLGLLMNGFHTE